MMECVFQFDIPSSTWIDGLISDLANRWSEVFCTCAPSVEHSIV